MKTIRKRCRPAGPALPFGFSTGTIAPATLAQPAPGAVAQPAPGDIGTAQVFGSDAGGNYVATPGSAPAAAFATPPLTATEPTSVIGPNFIQQNVVPTAPYDEIIKFTPSAQNISPAGNGLQQNFQETIRGFQYTQFNTVLDGIVLPGSPTNFAPQSGAYIFAHDINSITVDRGPAPPPPLATPSFTPMPR